MQITNFSMLFLRVHRLSIWFLNCERWWKKIHRMQFDRKAVAHKKSLSSFLIKKLLFNVSLEVLLKIGDAGQLADPVVGRNCDDSSKNDSHAVTWRNNVHRKLSSRCWDYFAYSIISVDVSESTLKTFNEDHNENNRNCWHKQENCFEQEESSDESLNDCHDPSIFDMN